MLPSDLLRRRPPPGYKGSLHSRAEKHSRVFWLRCQHVKSLFRSYLLFNSHTTVHESTLSILSILPSPIIPPYAEMPIPISGILTHPSSGFAQHPVDRLPLAWQCRILIRYQSCAGSVCRTTVPITSIFLLSPLTGFRNSVNAVFVSVIDLGSWYTMCIGGVLADGAMVAIRDFLFLEMG